MLEDTAQTPAASPAETAPMRAGSAGRWDRRTREWRRRCELIDVFVGALGGASSITPALHLRISAAAEAAVLAERARSDYLRGKPVPLDDVTRAQRLALTAERQLDLPKAPASPSPPTLADYLRGKDAREADAA